MIDFVTVHLLKLSSSLGTADTIDLRPFTDSDPVESYIKINTFSLIQPLANAIITSKLFIKTLYDIRSTHHFIQTQTTLYK